MQLAGNFLTIFFISIGLFSIAAGMMLIFLIFVMLAAERRAEMGMARRRHQARRPCAVVPRGGAGLQPARRGAYLASQAMTCFASRAAAALPIAEALRYE